MKTKKLFGFTLIELLIVIAIIGILAVAFLPSLLSAPAKGRDTQRVADIQRIQKVLVNYNLESGDGYPSVTKPIADGLEFKTGGDTWDKLFKDDFGGALPSDPDGETKYFFYNPYTFFG